ncbi:MAG: tyrosine-type recombinase/integrase [Candidatus Pristimantibacillus sp.]
MAKKYPNVRERNGKFYFRFSIKDAITGKRVQKETGGYGSAKDAHKAGIRIQAELLEGTYIEEDNLLFSAWCDRWLKIYASTDKVKRSTVVVRRGSLNLAKKSFGGLKLREISKLQYQDLLNKLKDEGKSKSTISLLHDAMRMLFKKAVQMEVIKTDITSDAEMPAFRKTVLQLETETELPQYLEKEELVLLLQAADEYGDEQFFRAIFILAYTGMRIGELCALKLTDIDEVNKIISITKTLHEDQGISNFEIGTPKTYSSARKIDVSGKVIAVIKDQLAWRKEYRVSKGALFYTEEDYIFINKDTMPGRPMSKRRFQEYVKDILRLACLPQSITPHSLRHTYTSLMAEAGVELIAIQRLLGHKNGDVTTLIYLHVTKTKKREAVEKLDDLLDGIL